MTEAESSLPSAPTPKKSPSRPPKIPNSERRMSVDAVKATDAVSRRKMEIDMLRKSQLAKNHKNQFKGGSVPLTKEELAALQAASKSSHRNSFSHSMSGAGSSYIDPVFLQQRKTLQEERRRKSEAAALLRGYRGSFVDGYHRRRESDKRWRQNSVYVSHRHNYDGDSVCSGLTGFSGDMDNMSVFSYDDNVSVTSATKAQTRIDAIELVMADDRSALANEDQDSLQRSRKTTEDVTETGAKDLNAEMNKEAYDDMDLQNLPTSNNNAAETSRTVDDSANEEKKVEEDGTPIKNEMRSSLRLDIIESPCREDILSPKDDKSVSSRRKRSAWRNFISSEEGSQFPPEKDRYHLYVSMACPWAHRTLLARGLKGLEDVISITTVHPVWKKTRPDVEGDEHRGWVFGDPDGEPFSNTLGMGGPFPPIFKGNEPDELNGCTSIRGLYDLAKDTVGKYTLPLLWDKKSKTIVSNESSEIVRMLNTEFNAYCQNPNLDLYPDKLQKTVCNLNRWIYPTFINGVYRCGLATSQSMYNNAVKQVTAAFDKIEKILKTQRFLAGDVLTEADIRLFPTLLRFDEVYTVYFKTNTRMVTHSPTLLNYCRDIYQMPGVAETVDMEQIKYHYYCSHAELNKHSIVPMGIGFVERLGEPHNREKLTRGGTATSLARDCAVVLEEDDECDR